MTDLISRPTRRGTGEPDPAKPERGLSAAAVTGGLVAAGATLAVAMSVALTGWFLADAGGHGDTKDALRVGALGWLAGHGGRPEFDGIPLGITPLAVTMILVLAAFRAGRWAVRLAGPSALQSDDRGLGVAAGLFTSMYVVVAILVGVLASATDASVSLPRTLLGALLVGGLAGGLGLAYGTGRLDAWLDRAPAWAREIGGGAVAGALALVWCAALLAGTSLLVSFNDGATVLSELELSTGDLIAYTVVGALLVPNAVLLSAAYLLGPGFAVGVGTTVSPTAVSLGAVPAVPLLAALPDEGPAPAWLKLLMAAPALAAAIGVCQTRRGAAPVPYDLAVLRGAASGFGAGVLITVAIALAGGPMGTGRLTEIGAPGAEVLVFATGVMAVGGALGGLVCTTWQRWRGAEWAVASPAATAASAAAPADGSDDETVRLDLP